jgi:hypothetical protein
VASYLGLIPSEHSSGGVKNHGPDAGRDRIDGWWN